MSSWRRTHGVSGDRASCSSVRRGGGRLEEGDTLFITTLNCLSRFTQNMLAFAAVLRGERCRAPRAQPLWARPASPTPRCCSRSWPHWSNGAGDQVEAAHGLGGHATGAGLPSRILKFATRCGYLRRGSRVLTGRGTWGCPESPCAAASQSGPCRQLGRVLIGPSQRDAGREAGSSVHVPIASGAMRQSPRWRCSRAHWFPKERLPGGVVMASVRSVASCGRAGRCLWLPLLGSMQLSRSSAAGLRGGAGRCWTRSRVDRH